MVSGSTVHFACLISRRICKIYLIFLYVDSQITDGGIPTLKLLDCSYSSIVKAN